MLSEEQVVNSSRTLGALCFKGARRCYSGGTVDVLAVTCPSSITPDRTRPRSPGHEVAVPRHVGDRDDRYQGGRLDAHRLIARRE
jgi:hypothetical protein